MVTGINRRREQDQPAGGQVTLVLKFRRKFWMSTWVVLRNPPRLRQLRVMHRLGRGTLTILLVYLPVRTLTLLGAISRTLTPTTRQTTILPARPTSIAHPDPIRSANADIPVVKWGPEHDIFTNRSHPGNRATHGYVHLLQVWHREQRAECCPCEIWCDPFELLW